MNTLTDMLLFYQGGSYMGKLDNKVAIVTGGNAGVGKAIAKLFASEGAKVVISARRKEVLEEVGKKLKKQEALFYVYLLIFLRLMMLRT